MTSNTHDTRTLHAISFEATPAPEAPQARYVVYIADYSDDCSALRSEMAARGMNLLNSDMDRVRTIDANRLKDFTSGAIHENDLPA
jgi:HD superfamily phosphohydrolase YqeK